MLPEVVECCSAQRNFKMDKLVSRPCPEQQLMRCRLVPEASPLPARCRERLWLGSVLGWPARAEHSMGIGSLECKCANARCCVTAELLRPGGALPASSKLCQASAAARVQDAGDMRVQAVQVQDLIAPAQPESPSGSQEA